MGVVWGVKLTASQLKLTAKAAEQEQYCTSKQKDLGPNVLGIQRAFSTPFLHYIQEGSEGCSFADGNKIVGSFAVEK